MFMCLYREDLKMTPFAVRDTKEYWILSYLVSVDQINYRRRQTTPWQIDHRVVKEKNNQTISNDKLVKSCIKLIDEYLYLGWADKS